MIDIAAMHILIADDVESMFNAIRSIMRILGFGKRFHYVPNGDEALAALRQGSFDIAFIDNNMPGMTGLELLQIIRSDKMLRDMPVVMISGHAEKEFISTAAESDIDAYILKPITVKLMKEKIPPIIAKANNPSPMTCRLRAAAGFAEQGNFEAAIAAAREAVAANPNASRPLRELGWYFLQQGDVQEATTCLRKAVAMNPMDVIALTSLGDVYQRANDLDNALRCFLKAMDISPRNYERALQLGKLLVIKKMSTRALNVFSKVFELARDSLPLKEEIADYCLAEKAPDIAAKLLKSILEHDPARHDMLYRLGIAYEQAGNADDALRCFIEAEDHDPRNVQIKLAIAKNYIARGKTLFAERPLRAVMKIEPGNAEAEALLRQCV